MILWTAYHLVKGLRWLEVILHMGAHRTGTTTFQRTLQENRQHLHQNDVEYWGPGVTRSDLLQGVFRAPEADDVTTWAEVRQDRDRVAMECDRLAEQGRRALVVSDENFLGTMEINLRYWQLYPGLGSRLERAAAVFGRDCRRIGLAVRAYDTHWASVLSFLITRRHPAPALTGLGALVDQPRRWRHVIEAILAAFPRAQLLVWPFEPALAAPDAHVGALTQVDGLRLGNAWHNASPPGRELRESLVARGDMLSARRIRAGNVRYMPFDRWQRAALQADYEQDIAWLESRPAKRLEFMPPTGATALLAASQEGTR